jgi:hypothetical protein
MLIADVNQNDFCYQVTITHWYFVIATIASVDVQTSHWSLLVISMLAGFPLALGGDFD